MKTSDACLTLIKSFEGLRLEAYRDIAGVWTIGYGWTQDVEEGDEWTAEEAEDALLTGLKTYEDAVTEAISRMPTTQHQFDAMVSLAYNIGAGNFNHSSVLRFHKTGSYVHAADAFLLWNKSHVGGQLVPVGGLTRRRAAERGLYMT